MDIQRGQLSEFLKGCRARIGPAEVGLPEPERRRTPGLRREDVAALAAVSVTWYTWLEQGRDIRVSADVLERISATLRLSRDERDYLFALVQGRSAPIVPGQSEEVSPCTLRMIEALCVPALVMTIRWDVIAWNALITRIFRDYSQLPPQDRNLLKILLTAPEYQLDPEEYQTTARRVLAKFRVDYSQAAGDPAFEQLISELNAGCEIFRRLWLSPEILAVSEGINIVRHVQAGSITFEHSSYVPEGNRNLRVIVFVPKDEDSARKVARFSGCGRLGGVSGAATAEEATGNSRHA
jgi:transcriptional regulator with XRE-family HTH domain